jgi:2-polyprenyl-3-methyl-5-hydroxy-6-metoxy-1,4-benzoquinol methylase
LVQSASEESAEVKCNLCGAAGRILAHYERKARPAAPRPQAYRISESHLEKPDRLIRCMTCGLVYALDARTPKELAGEYAEMADPGYLEEEEGRRHQARMILAEIAKVARPGGRLLDVGCGPGLFLDEARKKGWDAAGLDLSTWARKWGKEHYGVDIATGTLEEVSFPAGSFDVVVMLDVIEHLKDPKTTLAEARRILKNGGVLCVSTPDIESFWSRLLGARWWGINKYHLFYFSQKTLGHLFEKTGFRKVRNFPYPRIFSLGYWAKRLEPYPALVRGPVAFAARVGPLRRFPLKVNLNDQIAVLARKVRRLDSLGENEEGPAGRTLAPAQQKVAVVLPAYNAARTLEKTVADIPKDCVDGIILVDDKSRDETVAIARKLGLAVYEHPENRGYGANQKTCYDKAIEAGADIVVMVHPDYQYDPRIIPQLIEPIRRGEADAVFGSRMMKGGALEGGMPLWKHNANILLTALENVVLGTYLTEYHSGFRAYRTAALRRIRYRENSDGFVFDTEIIVQLLANHLKIDEVPIRTRYFEEASTIAWWPSVRYGLSILWVMARFILHANGIWKCRQFEPA